LHDAADVAEDVQTKPVNVAFFLYPAEHVPAVHAALAVQQAVSLFAPAAVVVVPADAVASQYFPAGQLIEVA